jgi:hypothetical protein
VPLGGYFRLLPSYAAFYISSLVLSLLVSPSILTTMNYIFAVLISLHCALRVSANPIQPTVTPPALRPRQQDVDLENDERFLAYWYYPTSGTSYLTPALCNIDEFFTTSATIGTTYAACCSRYTFSGGSTWDCSAQITTACSDGTIAFYSDTSTTW